uniref:Uncharacterized protein n=1 Tax=Chromera velia CCMP2878 TaxID=1169474 RepID=A0A0G4H3H9_9ALVE|eukprot:Cvel_5645.t1-p1 / transcript=Cvel_5645.t1 / gene=Cvel_5645 / organism=Chromera_velia_CCMP2878 / gene_product=hypothetical protein / transcript_product=hypothetical protein / location=Cvel_scaffold266:73865-74179(+) / protein_length=105 / sequence_SO=supercontig / SO=protein_coding / is_pseudo=false
MGNGQGNTIFSSCCRTSSATAENEISVTPPKGGCMIYRGYGSLPPVPTTTAITTTPTTTTTATTMPDGPRVEAVRPPSMLQREREEDRLAAEMTVVLEGEEERVM